MNHRALRKRKFAGFSTCAIVSDNPMRPAFSIYAQRTSSWPAVSLLLVGGRVDRESPPLCLRWTCRGLRLKARAVAARDVYLLLEKASRTLSTCSSVY